MRDAGHSAPDVGDDIHDRTGAFSFDPLLRGALHHVPGTVEVRVDDGIPSLDLEVQGHLRKLAAGVVYENVERAEPVPDIVDEMFDLIRIPYGQRGAENASTHSFQKRNRRGKPFFVASAYSDVRAQSCKEAGYGLAEAASATGNHYLFSGEEICAIDRRQSFQFIIEKPKWVFWASMCVVPRKLPSRNSFVFTASCRFVHSDSAEQH